MAARDDPFSRLEYEGWERVADRYESTWAGLTRLFIPAVLDAAGITPGQRMLDIACGPGYAAATAAERGASPVGVDFSTMMIRQARASYPALEFHVGDAQALAFPPASFDSAVMNFGVLHLADPEAAFREAARCLQPGGRYAFSIWAGAEHSPGAKLVYESIAAEADMSVSIPAGPDYFGYASTDDYRPILRRNGFDPDSVEFRTVVMTWVVPDSRFIFRAERDAGVRTATLLAAQPPEVLDRIEATIASGIAPYARGTGFAVPYGAHIISARAET